MEALRRNGDTSLAVDLGVRLRPIVLAFPIPRMSYMSSRFIHRTSGGALLAGGVAGTIVPALHSAHGAGYYLHAMTAASHLLLFCAVLLVSLGLPGLVARGGAGRWAAHIGAAAAFVGLWCLDGTHGLIDGAVLPALAAAHAPFAAALASGHASQELLAAGPLGTITTIGIPLFAVGSLLLGITLARAGRLPRLVGWATAGAWVLAPVSFVIPALRGVGVALPYVSLAGAGVALLRGGSPTAVGVESIHRAV